MKRIKIEEVTTDAMDTADEPPQKEVTITENVEDVQPPVIEEKPSEVIQQPVTPAAAPVTPTRGRGGARGRGSRGGGVARRGNRR